MKFLTKGREKMLSAIINRHSVRKYKSEPVSKKALKEMIHAGRLAPSSKNRQPWKFVVVSGKKKEEALNFMSKGLEREMQKPLLPESAQHINGAFNTLNVMKQAPVIIFVVNTLGIDIRQSLSVDERVYETCNAMSIGAAMENMALTAAELGLGSLWICDTYFAYDELNEWLNAEGELIAAMAVGHPEFENGFAERKNVDEIVEWRE